MQNIKTANKLGAEEEWIGLGYKFRQPNSLGLFTLTF